MLRGNMAVRRINVGDSMNAIEYELVQCNGTRRLREIVALRRQGGLLIECDLDESEFRLSILLAPSGMYVGEISLGSYRGSRQWRSSFYENAYAHIGKAIGILVDSGVVRKSDAEYVEPGDSMFYSFEIIPKEVSMKGYVEEQLDRFGALCFSSICGGANTLQYNHIAERLAKHVLSSREMTYSEYEDEMSAIYSEVGGIDALRHSLGGYERYLSGCVSTTCKNVDENILCAIGRIEFIEIMGWPISQSALIAKLEYYSLLSGKSDQYFRRVMVPGLEVEISILDKLKSTLSRFADMYPVIDISPAAYSSRSEASREL